MSCARYSSAARPTADALTRNGMSLETRVTRPAGRSSARFNAHARMRESLLSLRNPAGSTVASVWFSSTCRVPPAVADRHRGVQPAVLDPQLVQQPQRLPGEIAELGMVPLGLQLTDDDQGQHHLVFVEAVQRPRIGQQHGGVDDVGAARPVPPTGFRRRFSGGVRSGRPVCDHGRLPGGCGSPHPASRGGPAVPRKPGPALRRRARGPGPAPSCSVLHSRHARFGASRVGTLPTIRTVPRPPSRSRQTRKTSR